jgi:hypothetical protein
MGKRIQYRRASGMKQELISPVQAQTEKTASFMEKGLEILPWIWFLRARITTISPDRMIFMSPLSNSKI